MAAVVLWLPEGLAALGGLSWDGLPLLHVVCSSTGQIVLPYMAALCSKSAEAETTEHFDAQAQNSHILTFIHLIGQNKSNPDKELGKWTPPLEGKEQNHTVNMKEHSDENNFCGHLSNNLSLFLTLIILTLSIKHKQAYTMQMKTTYFSLCCYLLCNGCNINQFPFLLHPFFHGNIY